MHHRVISTSEKHSANGHMAFFIMNSCSVTTKDIPDRGNKTLDRI